MSRAEIIDGLARSKKLQQVCKNIAGGNDLHKDLFQWCIESLIKMSDEAFSSILNYESYCVRIAHIGWNGKNSDFYRLYRSFELGITDENYNNEVLSIDNIGEGEELPSEFRLTESDKLNETSGTIWFKHQSPKEHHSVIDHIHAVINQVISECHEDDVLIWNRWGQCGYNTNELSRQTRIPVKTLQERIKIMKDMVRVEVIAHLKYCGLRLEDYFEAGQIKRDKRLKDLLG